ncbi:hypothetical protein CP903_18850 [Enterobacter cloacae]|nr:hypothetical protein CP903_18850 [Enterobacter cloacae]
MNLSGVISRVFACYMVKKGTKKDAFYPEEIHWRHDASPSATAAHHRARAGAGVV